MIEEVTVAAPTRRIGIEERPTRQLRPPMPTCHLRSLLPVASPSRFGNTSSFVPLPVTALSPGLSSVLPTRPVNASGSYKGCTYITVPASRLIE